MRNQGQMVCRDMWSGPGEEQRPTWPHGAWALQSAAASSWAIVHATQLCPGFSAERLSLFLQWLRAWLSHCSRVFWALWAHL